MLITNFILFLCFLFTNEDNSHILIKQGTSAKQYSFTDHKIGRYQIKTNYQKTHLILIGIENIETMKISDQLNDLGDEIPKCSDKANLCQIRTINTNSSIQFTSSLCVGTIYLTFKKKIEESPSSFIISITKDSNSHCKQAAESPSLYCGESSIEDCKQCHRPSCTVIQCGNEVNNVFNTISELCVPYFITKEERLSKCQKFNQVTTFHSSGHCEYDDLKGYSNFTITLIVIFVIGIIAFSAAIIYYNIYFYKYDQQPFNVPLFMPEFLFPRKDNHRNTIDNLDSMMNPM